MRSRGEGTLWILGVCKGIIEMKEAGMGFVRFAVGDGTRILLWHNKWCGAEALKVSFPSLCNLLINRNEVVAEWIEWVWYSLVWVPLLGRNLREAEVGDLVMTIWRVGDNYGLRDMRRRLC